MAALSAASLALLLACSSDSTSAANATGPEATEPVAPDSGTGGPVDGTGQPGGGEVGPACPPCGPDQVCASGACKDLPKTCPCPIESFCDLSTATCKVGCTDDAQCSKGRICDAASRSCRAGCRADGDCGAGKVCDALVCRSGCRDDSACAASAYCKPEVGCLAGCRSDASCSGADICDAATHICRAGCRAKGDCPIENVCKSTQCVPGCSRDTDCAAGRVCTSGMCRDGCRTSAECGADAFCSATRTCTPFTGSGRCLADAHCPSRQPCDLATLRCTPPTTGDACFGGTCSACGSGKACIGDRCIARDEGTYCGSILCAKDTTCSPTTLKCEKVNCGGSSRCAAGLQCTFGNTCESTKTSSDYWFCNDREAYACTTKTDCPTGIACEGGKCTATPACAVWTDCPSNAYVCVAGRCTPHFNAPCTADADCGSSGLHCEVAVGRCGRN